MTLIAIVVATLVAGLGSVWIAAGLMALGESAGSGPATGVGPRYLLSLAAGALLATAFMHLLPEAFESPARPAELFGALLGGVVFFFLLDKAELWHHGHEHHHEGHVHGPDEHAHDAPVRAGGWAILTGDSVHCFGDGMLIASAFIADMRLGLLAALAVMAHEIPHHVGDLVVLRQTSKDRSAALLRVSLAGTLTMVGGVAGWLLVDALRDFVPYFLVLASSSFIYVALADLIPQLQQRLSARETVRQIASLLAGIALVTAVSGLAHAR
jgi:zinc and cadmium transporter